MLWLFLECEIKTENKLLGKGVIEAAVHFRIVVLEQVALGDYKRVGECGVDAELADTGTFHDVFGQCVAECDVLNLEV